MSRHASTPSWLLPAQGAAIAAHLLPGGPRLPVPAWARGVGVLAMLAGGGTVAAAARSLGRDLTPSVEPRAGSELRTTGPYALSRHPMYAGLLLLSAGAVLARGRASTAAAAAALAAVLHVKAGAEDQVLAQRFGEQWKDYRTRVPLLVGLPQR